MTSDQPALSLRNPNVQQLRRLSGAAGRVPTPGSSWSRARRSLDEALAAGLAIEAVFVDAAHDGQRLASLRRRAAAEHHGRPRHWPTACWPRWPTPCRRKGSSPSRPGPTSTLESLLGHRRPGLGASCSPASPIRATPARSCAPPRPRRRRAWSSPATAPIPTARRPCGPRPVRCSACRSSTAGADRRRRWTRCGPPGSRCVGTVAADGDDHRRGRPHRRSRWCSAARPTAWPPRWSPVLDRRVTIPMRGVGREPQRGRPPPAVLGYERDARNRMPAGLPRAEG